MGCLNTDHLILSVILLLSQICNDRTVLADPSTGCKTADLQQGVCVARRFCRHSLPVQVACSGKHSGLFCCPFPGNGDLSVNLEDNPIVFPGEVQIPPTTDTVHDLRQPHEPETERPLEEDIQFRPDPRELSWEKVHTARSTDSPKNTGREREWNIEENHDERRYTTHRGKELSQSLNSTAKPSTKPWFIGKDIGRTSSIPTEESSSLPDMKKHTYVATSTTPMIPTSQQTPSTLFHDPFHGEDTNDTFEPACGQAAFDKFIAGGRESNPNRWPWMAAIFQRFTTARPTKFICGGSLINTNYVLTAGHCFVSGQGAAPLPASSFLVRVGSGDLENGGDEYSISEVIVHSNFSYEGQYNDIAMLKLTTAIPGWSDTLASVCLPYPNLADTELEDHMATVIGWGVTSLGGEHETRLQEVSIPIVSLEDCALAYSRIRGAAFLARGSTHVLCAGLKEGGKDSCKSDSGGPLMMKLDGKRWTIIGIVSFGYRCAEPGFPGVYTRITHYLEWIYANTHS